MYTKFSNLDHKAISLGVKEIVDLMCTILISSIWSSNLDPCPTYPSFKHGLDSMKSYILTKFHEDWIKTVPSNVHKIFPRFDLLPRTPPDLIQS